MLCHKSSAVVCAVAHWRSLVWLEPEPWFSQPQAGLDWLVSTWAELLPSCISPNPCREISVLRLAVISSSLLWCLSNLKRVKYVVWNLLCRSWLISTRQKGKTNGGNIKLSMQQGQRKCEAVCVPLILCCSVINASSSKGLLAHRALNWERGAWLRKLITFYRLLENFHS